MRIEETYQDEKLLFLGRNGQEKQRLTLARGWISAAYSLTQMFFLQKGQRQWMSISGWMYR